MDSFKDNDFAENDSTVASGDTAENDSTVAGGDSAETDFSFDADSAENDSVFESDSAENENTVASGDSAETDFSFDGDTIENDSTELFSHKFSHKETRLEKISKRLYGKKYLALCYLVPSLILLLIYVFMRVYPFGENSVLVLDLNGQYVYYFEALRDILRGDGSLLYSFERALGGEFMGIFAYYLASPLNFIIALFPEGYITEALLTLLLLKCGLCGYTFGLYVHTRRPRRPVQTVMFSTMWALCAYNVVMQHNLMWTDCIILLPVVMMGIERLIVKGRSELFIISLSVAVFSNFYIGYMMCIFSALYFFAFYFSKDSEEINPRGEKFHFAKRLCRMGFSAVIVVSVTAIILLPTYYSLSFGKSDFSTPSYVLEQKNDFLEIFTKLYFGSYDTVRPEGLPFLYTGMLTLILVPLYFMAKKVSLREKISSALLSALLLLSMNGSLFDIIWHGFQKPNWLNYRYCFILCFFLLYMAYRAFEEIGEFNIRYICGTALFFGVLLIIMQAEGYDNLPDLSAVWLSLIFLLVYMLCLRGVLSPNKITGATACASLAIIVCFEMFAGGLINLYALDNDVSYSSRTSYRSFIDALQPVVDGIKEADDGFYRMEKTDHRKTNDNFTLGMRGLSNSTSTLNRETIDFLNKIGLSSKSHWSKYLGSTEVADSLLGVKYIIRDNESAEFSLYEEFSRCENYTVYKNPYCLSVAYGVSPLITTSSFTDDSIKSPLARQNNLLGEMTGSETSTVFRPVEWVMAMENVSEINTSAHRKFTKAENDREASVTFYLLTEEAGPLYMYIPSSYLREVSLTLNGEPYGTYFGNETYRVLYLGDYEAEESVSLKMELKKDDLYNFDGENIFTP